MKYYKTFLQALQVNFQYRINILLWMIVGWMTPFVMTLVWFAILGTSESIGGYTRGDFVVYYLFMTIGWYIVGGTFGGTLGDAIRFGEINKTLLKPYHIVLEYALKEQAWKLLSFLFTIPIAIVLMYMFRASISIDLTIPKIVLVFVSLILGGFIFACIEACIGTSAFWIIKVWPVYELFAIGMYIFGGRLAPLTLMPASIQAVASVLPFKYMFYVPISILLGTSVNPPMDVGVQFLYVLLLYILFRLIWSLGIRRYEAIGG